VDDDEWSALTTYPAGRASLSFPSSSWILFPYHFLHGAPALTFLLALFSSLTFLGFGLSLERTESHKPRRRLFSFLVPCWSTTRVTFSSPRHLVTTPSIDSTSETFGRLPRLGH